MVCVEYRQLHEKCTMAFSLAHSLFLISFDWDICFGKIYITLYLYFRECDARLIKLEL